MKRYFLLIALLATLYGCGVQRLVPLSSPPPESAFSSVREEYRPLADSIARHTGYVPREGNDFRVIYEGQDKLKSMLDDIHLADFSIYVELFRINPGAVSDTLFHAMEAKARDSLDVRLLPERFSHMTRSISRYLKMRKSGVSVEEWHPRGHFFSNIWEVNRRNHRKFTLVDANVGYIGGRNIAEEISGWSYSLEALMKEDPDYIIVRREDSATFCSTKPYNGLSAVRNWHVIGIESSTFDLQVPRSIDAIIYLRERMNTK